MKKHLLKLLTAAASLIMVVTLAACGQKSTSASSSSFRSELQQKNTLTIGLEGTYAPYSYRKNGRLTGFEVELGKDIAKKLGVKAAFVPTKWDSLIAGLGSKKFDLVLNNITITNARKKVYRFSTPYIYQKSILITRQGEKHMTGLKQVKGQKLAEGTGTDSAVVAKNAKAVIVPSDQFSTDLSLIRQGRVRGTINSQAAWYDYARHNNTKGLVGHNLPTSQVPAAKVAGLLNKQDPKLQKKVSAAITALEKDGTLQKLSKHYFGGDITEK